MDRDGEILNDEGGISLSLSEYESSQAGRQSIKTMTSLSSVNQRESVPTFDLFFTIG